MQTGALQSTRKNEAAKAIALAVSLVHRLSGGTARGRSALPAARVGNRRGARQVQEAGSGVQMAERVMRLLDEMAGKYVSRFLVSTFADSGRVHR